MASETMMMWSGIRCGLELTDRTMSEISYFCQPELSGPGPGRCCGTKNGLVAKRPAGVIAGIPVSGRITFNGHPAIGPYNIKAY